MFVLLNWPIVLSELDVMVARFRPDWCWPNTVSDKV